MIASLRSGSCGCLQRRFGQDAALVARGATGTSLSPVQLHFRALTVWEMFKPPKLPESLANDTRRRQVPGVYDKEEYQARTQKERSKMPKRIRYNSSVCPRSALFVPGHKPRALVKTLDSANLPADCFILDLEDSVGPEMKREAREGVQHFMKVEIPAWQKQQELDRAEQLGAAAAAAGSDEPTIPSSPLLPRFILRINSPDVDPSNAMLDLELASLLGDRIEGVAIPKVNTATFDRIRDTLHPNHTLWAFFETPTSILQAQEICASRRYRAAVMGYNDLMTELALPNPAQYLPAPNETDRHTDTTSTTTNSSSSSSRGRSGGAAAKEPPRGGLFSNLSGTQSETVRAAARLPLSFAAMQVLFAARANHMFLLDGVFNDPTDTAGFQEDLRRAFALGFEGKTLIHPSQIIPTNHVYNPSPREMEWATEVIQAVEREKGSVASVQGKMVEALHVRQADRLWMLHRNALAEEEEEEETQRQG